MTNECPVCGAEQAEGLLCHSCTTALERDLGDVPAIVAELDVTISKMARIGQGGKGGLASERTPINTGASAVADDLTNTLTTWARDVLGGRTTGSMISHAAVASSCVLLSHVPEIRRHPAVNELFDEITDAIKQARRVVDRPADRHYLGKCLAEFEGITCTEEVYAKPGATWATCRVCGITHEAAERREAMLGKLEDLLFSVKEASQLIGELAGVTITEASIRGYLHRNRLAYRPGTSTIRLGDLIDVVMDDSGKKSA